MESPLIVQPKDAAGELHRKKVVPGIFYVFLVNNCFLLRLSFAASRVNPVANNSIVAGSGTGAVKPDAEIVNVSVDVYAPVTTLTLVMSVPVPVTPAKIPVPPVMM